MTEPSTIPGESPRRAATRRRRSAHQQVAQRQRRQAQVRWLAIAAAVVAVAVIAGVVLWSRREAPPPVLGAVQSYENLSRQHTADPVNYSQQPPVGGSHDGEWQNCGFYAAPVRNENAVHALEHGAVWVTYAPDLPQEQVETLRALAEAQTFILVSPKDNLPAPVVASAWGKQLLLDSADDPALGDFVRRYRLDPAGPEPGAPCTGGTSETV